MTRSAIVSLIILLFISEVKCQTPPPFEKGDRVAFVGNSITEAGFYETYIWLYYMTHFPDQRIKVMNVGIGGDVSRQISDRLESDAFAKEPTVVVVTFGMNDSGYYEYNGDNPEAFADQKVSESYKHFQKIIDQLNDHPEVDKIIMSSSPYDETMKNEQNYFPGKSKTMDRIVAFQREEASKNNWPFVDLYGPMTTINLEGQKQNPEFTITGPDRIHPGNGGHLVMAYIFLKEQGLAGKPVAKVAIDSKKKKVADSDNATIQNLSVTKDKLTFDYLAKSLPFPVDTTSRMWGNDQKQSLALEVVQFVEDMSREFIQVTALKADKNYRVLIDESEIGTWTGSELAEGINIGGIRNTPQYKQAWTVMNLALTIRNIENKIREYYWIQYDYFKDAGMLFQNDEEAVEAARQKSKEDFWVKTKMDTYEAMRFDEIRQTYLDQIKTIEDVIYEVNQPKLRKVEIIETDSGRTP